MSQHQVYFVQRRDGLVKIGTSHDFERRLTTIAKSHGPLTILKVINGDQAVESRIQKALKAHHKYGEWFRCFEELLEFIAKIDKGNIIPFGTSKQKEEWRSGEREFALKAISYAERLVTIRCKRQSGNRRDTIAALNADYGFAPHYLRYLLCRQTETITAYGLTKLKSSLCSEMELFVEELSAELKSEVVEKDRIA